MIRLILQRQAARCVALGYSAEEGITLHFTELRELPHLAPEELAELRPFLPGKGGLADRAGQTSSDEQYAYDREWFKTYAVADDKASGLADAHIPLFVSRGFSLSERAEIAYQLRLNRLDPGLDKRSITTMASTVTHRQKTVLVDYELSDRAIGFVMSHNMLDEYWDTERHSALMPPDPEINEIVPLPPAKLPPWDGKLQWLEEREANIPPPKPGEALIRQLAQARHLDSVTGRPLPTSPHFIAVDDPAPKLPQRSTLSASLYFLIPRLLPAPRSLPWTWPCCGGEMPGRSRRGAVRRPRVW
ncbi:hypothetical protein D9M68_505730 [compost metagenome]